MHWDLRVDERRPRNVERTFQVFKFFDSKSPYNFIKVYMGCNRQVSQRKYP
ncbi:hypothetical protein C1645_829507 [Glomus cerebriforme]|uniref:Uncharacterized protein n=1 Tax=Glomus cerebriforme TaxID=658196 RepID=A0A397SQH7_9GLOM|nr:hypothetical protein C1645_829507 [Glomus cerebriforme]